MDIKEALDQYFEKIETCDRATYAVGNICKPEGGSARLLRMKEFCLTAEESRLGELQGVILGCTLTTIFGMAQVRKYPDSLIVWRHFPEQAIQKEWVTMKRLVRVYYRLGWSIPGISNSV